MSSKKAKRIRKANRYIQKCVEDNLTSQEMSGFTPYSSLSVKKISEKVLDYNSYPSIEDAYLSESEVYYFDSETGTHATREHWSIFYKDSGKIDNVTHLDVDISDSRELGDTYFRIGLKSYKKFCKAWIKRSHEYYKIVAKDGISYLSSSNEAYNLINWLDDLPGTQKGKYSSYISFGNDEYYYA